MEALVQDAQLAADADELVDEDREALVQFHRLGLNLIDIFGDLHLIDRHCEIDWDHEAFTSGYRNHPIKRQMPQRQQ